MCIRDSLIVDRAQVPRNFDSAFVRCIDGSLQLSARYSHVRLERSHAPIRPVIYKLRRFLGARKMMHLDEVAIRAFEIRPRHIDMRADQLSFIDRVPEVEVRVSLDAAGRTDRCDARSQI